MTFTLYNLHDDYVDLIDWVVNVGQRVTSRGLPTLELTGVTLDVASVADAELLPTGVERGVNLRLAAVEALQLMSGLSRPDLVTRAAPTFTSVLVEPSDIDFGAYGPRVAEQLDELVCLLRREPDTRRAVLAIWRPGDLTHDGDRPCTLALQFLVRRSLLELHVTMRSQDVWLGTPYDVFMFTQLQLTLARELGVTAGRYVHHVGSLHVYERDLEAACDLRHRDSARPSDATSYPRGVVATDELVTGLVVAGRLLDDVDGVDTFTDVDRRANPWYAAQLARLGTPREESR